MRRRVFTLECPLYVREVARWHRKGRGVFSACFFNPKELIIDFPVLDFPHAHAKANGIIHKYTFEWTRTRSVIALGYGSLLNHSYHPNAVYVPLLKKRVIRLYSLKEIFPHDEITVNYNGDPSDQSPVGFHVQEKGGKR